jgi:alkanesulfonate monooxygenase SsuD/methylene tetrahydromethanopterin reductase-like flavin-dependent oxidoreductase (luciferase family)
MGDLLAIQTPKARAAVGSIAAGVARSQLPVEADEIKLLPVFPDQRALAGRQIEQKNIMPARVAVVEADRDLVWDNV